MSTDRSADVAATKMLRKELARRMIDTGQADLRVAHGVAYIRGVIRPLAGGPQDLKQELELIARVLRNSPRLGVKDVVVDCSFRT